MEQLANRKLRQIISCLNSQCDMTGKDIADVFWLALKQKEYSRLIDRSNRSSDFLSFQYLKILLFIYFEQIIIFFSFLLIKNIILLFIEHQFYKLALFICKDNLTQPITPPQPVVDNDRASVPISPPQDPITLQNSSEIPNSSLKGKTLPIRHIDPPSLRKPLEFAKALRPLMQKIDSGRKTILDEIKTVQKTAEQGICFPILTSEPEPLFDLALIIDENSSMVLWQNFVKDLKQLVEHYGIFREVSTWGLAVDNDRIVTLVSRKNKKAKSKNPEEIIDPSGRCLIIIVSDCVGERWFNGSLLKTLKNWSKYQPLALLQILPHSLWLRSGLKLGAAVTFTNSIQGNYNQNLSIKELLIWKDFDLEQGSKIPVFTVEIESSETDNVNNWSVSNWSKFLMGKHDQIITGFIFPSESEFIPLPQLPQRKIAELNAEDRIERFRRISSPLGRKLAGLLVASPVITLPIVRLIQENFLNESSSVHIGEVFLGGILKPLTEITPEINPDSIIFNVAVEGIRTQLLKDSPFQDSEMIFWTISDYIERKLGKSLRECVASLLQEAEDGTENLTLENVYARISLQILNNLGQSYARFARDIELEAKLKDLEFNVKTIETDIQETNVFTVHTEEVEIATVKVLRGTEEELFKLLRSKIDRSLISNDRLYQRMLEVISGLPEEFRVPLQLKYFQGLDDREILTRTNIITTEELTTTISLATETILTNLFLDRNLVSFESETVFVDRTGTIVERKAIRAYYYLVDFSDYVYESIADPEDNEYLENKLDLEMVYILGGKFWMGTEDEEIERLVKKFDWEGYRKEKPQHQVTVPSFYMSKYPITQGQWKAIALRTDLAVNKEIELPLEPSEFDRNPVAFSFPEIRGDLDLPAYGNNPTRWHRPVENITWYQAKEFCDRLSKLTGNKYRLPTEAEWEYACRAVTIDNSKEFTSEEWNEKYDRPFHFGETITTNLANYNGDYTYLDEGKGKYRKGTTPVGMFPPNDFGLHDLHGNVWEWCEDNWHDNYQKAPNDGSAWINESGKSNTAVVRGGSWLSFPDGCRCADRLFVNRDVNNYSVGFRLVCVIGRDS